ncbi:MAG: hypothetical protein WC745_03980 [Patescibacteria group bacterium]
MSMEEIKNQIGEEKSYSREEAAEFAQAIYKHELGRRKAVDKGVITMSELEIYFFANVWVQKNMPFIEDLCGEEQERVYDLLEKRVRQVAAETYSISEERVREIIDKVRKIPRAYSEDKD